MAKKVIAIILVVALCVTGLWAQGSKESEVAKIEPKFFSFASFNTGTFQYMYAAALAGEMLKIHPEYNITAEATSGTTENIDLLYRNEVVLASASPERLYNAFHALKNYQPKGKLNAGILWGYQNQVTLLFVKANSGINGFEDLAGKRVCIGAAGSSNEIKNSYVLDAYGYTRSSENVFKFNELTTYSIDFTEGANALADGTVQAIIATQPLPEPSLYELAMTTDVKVISIDPSKFAVLRTKYSWMWDSIVPAGSYRGQNTTLKTLGDPNYVLASLDNLSEADAYAITKAYVEKILPVLASQFDTVKPFADDINLLTANWVIPGHPGAVKYYEEIGLKCEVIKP